MPYLPYTNTLGPITMEKINVLNRACIILLFGVLPYQLNGQIDTQNLQREWIAIECRHATDTAGIYSIEGKLISFDDSQGLSYFFWNDSLIQFNYSIKDSLLVFNDTLIHGKILHLDNDSLLLLVDNATMITLFLPVEGNPNKISKQQLDTLLTKNTWTKRYWDGEYKIDFIDYNAFSSYVKYCSGIIDNKYDINFRTGYWSTFEHNGFVFLSIYLDPDEYYETGFFHITNFDSSSINAKYLSQLPHDSISFKPIENLSEFEINNLRDIFTSKDWRIDTVQETYQFYGLESRYPEEGIIPITRHRKNWLLKEDFLYKDTRYSFSDSTYSISCDSLPVFEGRWSLSRDGNYLYFNNEKSGSSINKILEINHKEITIRQKIDLKVSHETDEIMNYDYIIKLN